MIQTGRHGFPADIGTVQNIIKIAKAVGAELYARQADVIAVAKGDKPETMDVWAHKKPDGSSVTSSDIWSNDVIYQALKNLTPDLDVAIITEEGDKEENLQAAAAYASYVVDSLDNTGSYKRGQDDWSVTIGFQVQGRPTGGVVYYPAQGRLFFTGDDGNAYLFDEKKAQLIRLAQAEKTTENLKSGDTSLGLMTDHEVTSTLSQLKQQGILVTETHGGHTERYWDIALPGRNVDVCEHGDLFYAWDLIAPAAITSRAGIIYTERDGSALDFFAKRPGHNDFELPQSGFMAAHQGTLKALAALKAENASAVVALRVDPTLPAPTV